MQPPCALLQGVVPLDGVDVETVRTGPSKSHQSGFRISHASFGTKAMLLCASDDGERDKWVAALQSSKAL